MFFFFFLLFVSDFEIWKSDLESDNNVQYVKDTGAHLSKNKMNFFYYYRCNRTGKYRNHTNQQGRRRKLKSQGTDKINNHCTSSITVQEPLNKELDIKVTYCVTHYGHNIDLKHIRLSNAERNYIVERLKQGDSVDSILHEIKNSAVSTKFEKIHFVTRKNILRIGKSYGIDMVKEEEDKKERYSRKAKNTQERHNQAMAMPLSAVRKTSAESWIVSSNNKEEYTVIKNEFLEENHLCFSKCKDCEICIHLFSCECADNIVKSELCEHIHLVVRFLNEKDSMQNTGEESFGISSEDEEDLNKLFLQQEKPGSLIQKKEQVLSEIQKLTSAVMEIDDEETLDSVLQEVIVMKNILMKKQEGRSDKENLQELVNSVNNNRTGIQYTHKKIALGKLQTTGLFKALTKEFSMSDLLISVKK